MLEFVDEETYRIGEVAKRLGKTILTIKTWEKKGLIPKAKRDSRGWRAYTEDDIERIIEAATERGLLEEAEALALS